MPLLGALASRLPFTRGRTNSLGRLERFVRGAALDPREANGSWLSCFADAEKRSLYTAEFGGRMMDVDSMKLLRRFYHDGADVLDDVLHADLCLGLPDDLLTKVDVAS